MCIYHTDTTLCSKSDRTKAAGVLRVRTKTASFQPYKVIKRGGGPSYIESSSPAFALQAAAADSSCEEIVQENVSGSNSTS
jgi:hypothetical protein